MKREAAYRFLAKHLGLNLSAVLGPDGKLDESHVTPEKPEALHVFDAEHSVPPNAAHDAPAIARVLQSLQR